MKTCWLGVGLLVAVLAGAPCVGAQDAKAAETFVRQLYARYHTQKNFAPFADAATVQTLATPALAALVKREQTLSQAARDASELDADPVCGCQDDDGLQLTGVQIELTKPGRALATVHLQFAGKEHTTRRLFLVPVDGQWHIDNIKGAPGEDDVRKVLADSIATYTAAHKR